VGPTLWPLDPYRIKHVVEHEARQPDTHPVFFGVNEQFEDMARDIEEFREREAVIKLQRKLVRMYN
jgi:hypothetical protein